MSSKYRIAQDESYYGDQRWEIDPYTLILKEYIVAEKVI